MPCSRVYFNFASLASIEYPPLLLGFIRSNLLFSQHIMCSLDARCPLYNQGHELGPEGNMRIISWKSCARQRGKAQLAQRLRQHKKRLHHGKACNVQCVSINVTPALATDHHEECMCTASPTYKRGPQYPRHERIVKNASRSTCPNAVAGPGAKGQVGTI